jgi:hypothetical protein
VIHRFFSTACCMFAAVAVGAQTAPNFHPPPSTEQIETGFAPIHGRPYVPYQIRLLPISSFPQLPPEVALQLDRMGCMIPQTYEAREPENVIHGSFEKKGSSDWAALCSVDHVTTLYVFFQSDLANPIPLRHQPDSQWLGVEWSLDYGSAWGIARRPPRLTLYADHADHDGIDDAFIEQSSTVHYFREGHWTTIDGSQ